MSLLDLDGYELPEIEEPICIDCGEPLNVFEFIYYSERCEECEGAWSERLQAWRAGECDVVLDKAFKSKDSGED